MHAEPSITQTLKQLSEKFKTSVKNTKEKLSTSPSSAADFTECIHSFGYLKHHPKNLPVPDECFGCPKILRCLSPNESKTH
jgi:hypothetical protein